MKKQDRGTTKKECQTCSKEFVSFLSDNRKFCGRKCFEKRRKPSICNGCEHRKQNTTLIDFYYCDLCGCPLNKKIFAQDKNSCPKSKWDK